MKTYWMQRSLVVLAFLAAQTGFANVSGGVNPGYVRVKVYEIRVSPNADCTAGRTVFSNGAGATFDMVNNPTLGSGTIPDGTYNCVMLHMDDFIHYTPAAADASWSHNVCHIGTDYVSDVGHDETAIDPDGTSHPLGPKGTLSQVWLYVRTTAVTQNGDSPQSAFAPAGGIPLTAPLVVHGDGVHTMVFDFDGLIGEEQDMGVYSCDCDAPTLAFR